MQSKIIKKLKSFLSYSLKLFILTSFFLSQSFIAEIFLYQNNPNTKVVNTAKADYNDYWYNQSFLYRKQITIPRSINTVPNVPHTDSNNTNPYLSNFPVLISTTIPTNKLRPDHNDIIFTNQAGTQLLTYEIESYDTNGNLTAWVKLPQLNDANNTTDTSFYMYYDNSGYTDTTTNVPSSVWDSDFKGVWHLGEATPQTPAAGDYKDSTINHNDSTNTSGEPTHTDNGLSGGAQSFNGTSSFINVGNKNSLNITGKVTLDTWIKLNAFNSWAGPAGKNKNYEIEIDNNSGGRYIGTARTADNPNGIAVVQYGEGAGILSGWHHVVLVRDDSVNPKNQLYVNGVLVNSSNTGDTLLGTTSNLNFGLTSTKYFNGLIDEVRISDTARSADWIKTEYNNQSSSSTFYSLGGEENYTSYFASPVVAEVTPVPITTGNPAPSYTFSSTKIGIITYSGDCSSSTTNANIGYNTVAFNALLSGIHSNCTIQVTDGLGNTSNTLSVTPFTINTVLTTYIVPAVTDNKILPKSSISSSYIGDTISTQISNGEYKAQSFVVNSNVNLNSLQVEASNLTGNGYNIPNSALDIKAVKCWYQGGIGTGISVTGRYLTPELLLNNDSLVDVDGDSWNQWNISNPDGKNYLKVNGSYIDISDDTLQSQRENIVPISDRPIQDSATLQPINLLANYNKQFWITLHVPDNTPAGNYTGTISLKSWTQVIKNISVSLQVLPITLPAPNIEYSIYYDSFIDSNGSISSKNKTVQQYTAEIQDLKAHGITDPTIFPFGTDNNLLQELSIRQQIGLDNTNMYYVGSSINANSVFYYKNLTAPYGVVNLYLYGPDERPIDSTYRNQIDAEHNAGAKHFTAEWDSSLADSGADILDLLVAGRLWPEMADKYHDYGHKIYLYDTPQTVPEYPRVFRMNYGLRLWQNNYDGAMDFAYQWSMGDIWNDFIFYNDRSHAFAYPTSNGVIDTIQWEGFREGVNDMRYLTALENEIAAKDQNDATAIEAQNYLDNLKSSDLTNQDLDAIRSYMINYIIFLKSSAHALTINLGEGSGYYSKDNKTTITADTPPTGMTFYKWTGDTQYIDNINSANAVVTMPNHVITLTATYSSSFWYNSLWKYRKQIAIDHTKISNTDQLNFPVLVSLTDLDLKTINNGGKVRNSNGYDIIFTLTDGSLLNYEIENYDGSTGRLVAWVKIPVLSHTINNFFYIYYGNSVYITPNTQTNINSVWDSDFKGVWHLGEATPQTPAAGDYKDSTINQNNSTNTSGEPTHTDNGLSGGAQSFNGTSSFINVGNKNSLNITGKVTLDTWIKLNAFNSWAGPAGKNKSYEIEVDNSGGGRYVGVVKTADNPNGIAVLQYSEGANILNNWRHVVMVRDDSANPKNQLYVNGVLINSSNTGDTLSGNTSDFTLGLTATKYFNGTLDEVRISDTARSADWIKTEYNNESNPNTFSTLSSEENLLPPIITSLSANLPNGTYGTGTPIPITINFSKDVTSTGNITLTLNTTPQRTCSFTVTNNNSAICNYTIQGGDSATNLNATISGTIHDQFNNPMTNFTPLSSLSDNTTININTSSSPFTPPTKPNITSIQIALKAGAIIDLQSIPSNITQIAISLTPDFKGISWIDFDRKKFSTINQTTQTLYIKLRTNEGAVSDTIIITPQSSINNTVSLSDGDIIQCKSSNDPNAVYIVKKIGTKTYIRHITSIQIFNYYKHLKWENLKQVDSLTPFSLSSWIRVNTGTNGLPKTGDKVYEINGDQSKHWINMTAQQFLTHGGSDEAIYTVNSGELNLYSAGADVVSL